MTRLTGANWVDELPWVLLGIRTTPKEDINCSTAELVYGSPLTVPGDFIPGTNEPPNPSSLLPWLRQAISKFNFTPMSQHGVAPQHMPRELFNSPYVFIRRDSHKPPLTPPYEGPYKVLQRGTKSFRLMLAAGKKLFLWIASSLLLSTRRCRSNSVIPRDEEDHQNHNIAFACLFLCVCLFYMSAVIFPPVRFLGGAV